MRDATERFHRARARQVAFANAMREASGELRAQRFTDMAPYMVRAEDTNDEERLTDGNEGNAR